MSLLLELLGPGGLLPKKQGLRFLPPFLIRLHGRQRIPLEVFASGVYLSPLSKRLNEWCAVLGNTATRCYCASWNAYWSFFNGWADISTSLALSTLACMGTTTCRQVGKHWNSSGREDGPPLSSKYTTRCEVAIIPISFVSKCCIVVMISHIACSCWYALLLERWLVWSACSLMNFLVGPTQYWAKMPMLQCLQLGFPSDIHWQTF